VSQILTGWSTSDRGSTATSQGEASNPVAGSKAWAEFKVIGRNADHVLADSDDDCLLNLRTGLGNLCIHAYGIRYPAGPRFPVGTAFIRQYLSFFPGASHTRRQHFPPPLAFQTSNLTPYHRGVNPATCLWRLWFQQNFQCSPLVITTTVRERPGNLAVRGHAFTVTYVVNKAPVDFMPA
jgi:hypothetical protein